MIFDSRISRSALIMEATRAANRSLSPKRISSVAIVSFSFMRGTTLHHQTDDEEQYSSSKEMEYTSSKTLFLDSRSGEYSGRSRSIWAQEFRDCTSGYTRFPSHDTQSVVIPVPNMQILDNWSQNN